MSGNVVSPGASEDAYTLVGRTLLSSPDCAKQVYRIRLAAAHAIEYEPGDMMAVRYRNDDETVRRVLDAAFRGANDAGSDVLPVMELVMLPVKPPPATLPAMRILRCSTSWLRHCETVTSPTPRRP